jgi:ankyrin repeat protein
MPGPSIKEQSKQLNPDRHSTWLDGLKAGVVGGAVAGLPFAFTVSILFGTLAGAATDSVGGMGLAFVVVFGIMILQWAIFGAVVGAIAGHLAILRYQFDLTRLSIAMTIAWAIFDDVRTAGIAGLFSGLIWSLCWSGLMGGLLGFMIGWADRTWFKKSKSHFDAIRRGEDPSTVPTEPSPALRSARKAPIKVLPEAPKGEPPTAHNICKVPKNLPPLLAACKEGSRIKVEQLLAQRVDVHERTPKRQLSAMHIAAIAGVMDVADCLLSAGLNVDELADRGMTPLYMGIQTANMNMVGLLLSRGANINHINQDGYTPLHWACCAPHEQLVGSTRVKMVDLLLKHGADINQKDGEGRTPRDLAYLYELKELGTALDNHLGISTLPQPTPGTPAEPDAISVTSVERREDTEFATHTVDSTPVQVFKLEGAEVCQIPKDVPPLYQAIKEGDPHKTQMKYGEGGGSPAQLQEKVGAGLTAIHIASIVGAMGVVDLLVRAGVNVNEPCDRNMTPLFLAVQCNNTNVCGYLMTKGADVNHQNIDGLTPLHWACAVESGKLMGKVRVQMIQMLLQHGANLYQTTGEGLTARQLAEAAGHENVVEYLDQVSKPEGSEGQGYDEDDDDDYHL